MPPSRARFLNKKEQFEQQQQQLEQLWLHVEYCFQNCPFVDETCKKDAARCWSPRVDDLTRPGPRPGEFDL